LQLLRIGTLDALRYVIERENAEEIDIYRCPAFPAGILNDAREKRRLAVASRGHQPAVVAAGRPLKKKLGLLIAIKQLIRRDGLAVSKRISVLFHRATLLATIEQNVLALLTASASHQGAVR
jgi:hypothetical protein